MAHSLAPHFRLAAVNSPAEIERVAAFDALIHGPGNESTWRAWMAEHPHANPAHWLYIEDQTTNEVVASLCLLSWRLHYQGIGLRAAELGVVGTAEAYRNQGLQQVLYARFNELMQAGGYDLSHIQGIPYFYRQFGYEYAVPLEANWRLDLPMLPEAAPEGYACRLATLDDLPLLVAWYDQAAASFDLATLRDEATWRYLLGPALATETGAETWLIEGPAGAGGYFRVAYHGFGNGLIVNETSNLGYAAALAALAHLGNLAQERHKPYLRLNLAASNSLLQVAQSLGAHNGTAYAWQVRLLRPAALLQKLAPVFEQRIAASLYAGMNRVIGLDLYRERLNLHFVAGRLQAVEQGGTQEPTDLRLPPLLLAPLLLGHRSLPEINYLYPDAYAVGTAGPLIEVLFPPLRSWWYQAY
ncbi:MAG: GNAT family N-acetyltransferase [Oscillochloridaceae bacterium umkhey_bin13]